MNDNNSSGIEGGILQVHADMFVVPHVSRNLKTGNDTQNNELLNKKCHLVVQLVRNTSESSHTSPLQGNGRMK
jgi:hypothetical protein